jgi:hypothetical protein
MNKARHYHFNSTMPDQVDSAQRAVHRDQNFLLAGGFTVILIVLACWSGQCPATSTSGRV